MNEKDIIAGKLYHNVTLREALRGFDPTLRTPRNEPITLSGDRRCGEFGRTYGFVDRQGAINNIPDMVIYGINCFNIGGNTEYATTYLKAQGGRDSLTIEGNATFKIKVAENEIYYFKEGDIIIIDANTNRLVTKDQSKAAYLHECGHQLDVWRSVEKKRPITVLVQKTFYGRSRADVEAQANLHIDNILANLISGCENEIKILFNNYHTREAGYIGNPWTGYKS